MAPGSLIYPFESLDVDFDDAHGSQHFGHGVPLGRSRSSHSAYFQSFGSPSSSPFTFELSPPAAVFLAFFWATTLRILS